MGRLESNPAFYFVIMSFMRVFTSWVEEVGDVLCKITILVNVTNNFLIRRKDSVIKIRRGIPQSF